MKNKNMYKKGSFLEPSKELKFGRKRKYLTGNTPTREEKFNTPQGSSAKDQQGNLKPRTESRPATTSSVSSPKALTANTTSGYPSTGRPLTTPTQDTSAKSSTPAPGTYAYAKSRNPNLDKLIAERKNYARGSAEYNRIQNQINKAYGTGPMRTEITQTASKSATSVPSRTPSPRPTLQTSTPRVAATPTASKPAATRPASAEIKSSKPVDRRVSTTSTKTPKTNAEKIANKNARKNKRLNNMQERMDRVKSKMKTGGLKEPKSNQTGLKKLPTAVRNKMGYKKNGGMMMKDDMKKPKAKMEAGGMVDECQGGGCYNSQRAARTRKNQNQARRNPNKAKRREMGLGKSSGGNGLGSKILGLGALIGGAAAAKRFMQNS